LKSQNTYVNENPSVGGHVPSLFLYFKTRIRIMAI